MARVLFSVMSNVVFYDTLGLDPFYEGFLKELCAAGNEVMFIRTNDFLRKPDRDNSLLSSGKSKKRIIKEIRDFGPEIIITANNSIPEIILDNTECPVVLYVADTPPYFCSQDYIRKHVGRYFFLHGYDQLLGKVCEDLYGCRPDQNIYGGYATAVRAQTQTPTTNIVFIGTVGWPMNLMNRFIELETQEEFEKAILNFRNKTQNHVEWDASCLHVLTANNRIKTLDAIHDLGLEVYSWKQNFFQVIPYSMDLACCYKFRPVISLKDTEEVLNAAKISPSLYNAQAPGGLSWRCADVMASNACLISPYKKDLDLLSPYIKIPTFESPAECRDLCQKLLKDEPWRQDVVASCQKAIHDGGRFHHLFRRIGEAVGINLTPCVTAEQEKEQGKKILASPYLRLENNGILSRKSIRNLLLPLIGYAIRYFPETVVNATYIFLNKHFGVHIQTSTIHKLRKQMKTDENRIEHVQ